MTGALSEGVRRLVETEDFSSLSGGAGVLVVALLIVLLLESELVRLTSGRGTVRRLRSLQVATVPLLLAFGMLLLARFADLDA